MDPQSSKRTPFSRTYTATVELAEVADNAKGGVCFVSIDDPECANGLRVLHFHGKPGDFLGRQVTFRLDDRGLVTNLQLVEVESIPVVRNAARYVVV